MKSDLTSDLCQQALTARGGMDRFLGRLSRREPVTVVYFGTSVTTDGWPNHVTQWLRIRHPGATINAVNSSIGGTASDLGVFRVGRDVIAHRPDLVFVEFCNDLNDGSKEEVAFQMDGVLCQIRRALPACDVVVVHVPRQTYTELYVRGDCPPHIVRHEEAAERHQVPSVHASRVVAQSIAEGRLSWADFAGDIIHPNERGHRLLAEIVCECLERLENTPGGPHSLPGPLCEFYTRTRLTGIRVAELRAADSDRARTAWAGRLAAGELTNAWPERVDYYHRHIRDRMPDIWTLDRPGDGLRHEFTGTGIGIYDLHGPDTGSIAVRIDGRDVGVFNRFIEAGKTIYRLSNGIIFTRQLAPGRHEVDVTLLDARPPTGLPPVLLAGFWMEG